VCRFIPYHRHILIFSSTNSLALLPSEPKIFHGRDLELSSIIQPFSFEVPRIAILGAGGMGKTSLAKAVLHHPELTSRYEQHRLFVPCDTVSTSIQLAALIGAHVGLKSGKDLTAPVIRYFSNGPPTLLILDNLETIWEPAESRADVEKLLCHLTDVEHLALIVSTEELHSATRLTIRLGYYARSRETCHCAVDPAFSGTTEALGPTCCP
jgi:Cdc6-like AAA superfamily ATPase